jgi:hypothetical protein
MGHSSLMCQRMRHMRLSCLTDDRSTRCSQFWRHIAAVCTIPATLLAMGFVETPQHRSRMMVGVVATTVRVIQATGADGVQDSITAVTATVVTVPQGHERFRT